MKSDDHLLFRSDVLHARSNASLGAIRLAQPLSAKVIAVVALAIAAAMLSFIVLGSVTKAARVAGITVPIAGQMALAAPDAGVLTHSHVREGDLVTEGQTLFEISTARHGSHGTVTELVGQQLAIRQGALDSERRLRMAHDEEKHRALAARLQNYDLELGQLEQEIVLAQRRQALNEASLNKFETLHSSGYVASSQVQQKQEDLIDATARLGSLARSKVQLQASRANVEAERAALGIALQTDLTQFQQQRATLTQQLAENNGRSSSVVTAPQAGKITTLNVQAGQSVRQGQPLAMLIPAGGTSSSRQPASIGPAPDDLEVLLYAPSRTAGFVAPGQQVRIRYQAFPYQKFGLQTGVVTDVSQTPFAPGDLPEHLSSTILSTAQKNANGSNGREALYRIKVRLARQSVLAYGQQRHLKPGMTVEADIVQDRRRIWEWIAAPALALTRQ